MRIYGLQKTTLLDFPGHVASTIFLANCNMRCPFCHNMNLVLAGNTSDSDSELYDTENIIAFLKKRSGIIDGVCITGGEPTLYPDLPDFIVKIKELGLLVKLDTNGSNPLMLSRLINENLVDYVAMDIKSSLSTYSLVCGVDNFPTSSIENSIDILMHSEIDYEFRTTLIKQFHNTEVMEDIAKMLNGADKYFLQSFVDSEFVPDHSLCAPEADTIIVYKNMLSHYIKQVEVRGIDIS